MATLTWWEQMVFEMAISFLTALASKITNPVEKAALQSAIAFLQQLVGGGVAGVAKAAPRPAPSVTSSHTP